MFFLADFVSAPAPAQVLLVRAPTRRHGGRRGQRGRHRRRPGRRRPAGDPEAAVAAAGTVGGGGGGPGGVVGVVGADAEVIGGVETAEGGGLRIQDGILGRGRNVLG